MDDEVFVTAKEIELINDELPEIQEEQESSLADFEILNPNLPMRTKVQVATNVANCLSTVIRSQKLVKTGLNRQNPKAEYVLIDGWEILGTMLGITPATRVVGEITNKQGRIVGYKARAFLYRNPKVDGEGNIIDGDLIATAEASATKDGFQKETFSMMSMAQTRALSKAYRMALGWIMKMAKFESTPAEEMPKFKED